MLMKIIQKKGNIMKQGEENGGSHILELVWDPGSHTQVGFSIHKECVNLSCQNRVGGMEG